jgi:hypothetical protein
VEKLLGNPLSKVVVLTPETGDHGPAVMDTVVAAAGMVRPKKSAATEKREERWTLLIEFWISFAVNYNWLKSFG